MAGDEALRTPEEQSESNVIGSSLQVPLDELETANLHMPPDDLEAGNGTRSELNIQTLGNLKNTTRHIFLLDNNKSNDNKCNGEITSPLLEYKYTVCMLNKDEEVDKPFSPGKHMKTAQCVLSFLIATIAFLWILTDVCSLLSIIKLQPEHGPLFIWFSLLEPVGFMLFVCAVAAMIVIGAPFSRLLSAILLFWGIWLLIRSSKSLTALCLPILGILLMVWNLCSWKSSCQMKGNEQGNEAPKN